MNWPTSKKGWTAAVITAVYSVLDHRGRIDSLKEIYRTSKEILPPWSSISPFVPYVGFSLALLLFWRDKHTKENDLGTLRGRTIQLRDEMQKFIDASPSKQRFSASHVEGDLQVYSDDGSRVMRLHHGYDLRFADRVRSVFNEFGERSVRDNDLAKAMENQINRESTFLTVIDRLTKLAERSEAKY